jgi:hypothetical protein
MPKSAFVQHSDITSCPNAKPTLGPEEHGIQQEAPKHTLRDCLLARKSKSVNGGEVDDNGLSYQCTVSCAHGNKERDITGETVVNEWGDCG